MNSNSQDSFMSKRKVDSLYLGSISLRLLEERDLVKTLVWRNQDNIRIWFFNSEVLTRESHLRWYKKYCTLDNDFVFIIEFDHEPVGQVALYNIDWKSKDAEYGRLMIGESWARGKKISNIATNLLLHIGFVDLGLEKIHLEVKKTNITAKKIYSSCGFILVQDKNDILTMVINKNQFNEVNAP